MTTVNTITPTQGNPCDIPTPPRFTKIGHLLRDRLTIAPPKIDPLARRQDIENALSAALWHVRHGDTIKSIYSATGRAIRAVAMLKQACQESSVGGRV